MSWLFSRVLVEGFWAENCLDGKQLELLKENLMQQAYCSQDKMTVYSRLSRFGMMFAPFEQIIPNVQDLLNFYAQFVTSSLSAAASHAKTYPVQEKAQESQAKEADCGKSLPGLLAKYDPATHLLKTVQCSLIEDSMLFSVTLPRWGTMRNGACLSV